MPQIFLKILNHPLLLQQMLMIGSIQPKKNLLLEKMDIGIFKQLNSLSQTYYYMRCEFKYACIHSYYKGFLYSFLF